MGRKPHPWIAATCAALLMCSSVAARAEGAGGPDPDWREAVLELRINGVLSQQDVVALRDARGGLWLEEADFRKLRLRLPQAAPHVAGGKRYFPVNALPDTRVAFDEVHSAANITAPAVAFQSSRLALTGVNRPPMSTAG